MKQMFCFMPKTVSGEIRLIPASLRGFSAIMIPALFSIAALLPWLAVVKHGRDSIASIPQMADLAVDAPVPERPVVVKETKKDKDAGEAPKDDEEEAEAAAERPELELLSVVIAARDEADTVETALRSLAAQGHPNYEIIIVNDRSTDATGEIIDKLAAEFPGRIRAEHIQELPEGWLGKCNALHTGAAAAQGEYILFTDADVEFEPTVLERVHRYALIENADQVAVLPDTIAGSAGERAMLNAFGICFMLWFQPQRVLVKNSGKYVGIGAFNMVRSDIYRKIGGHRFLRLQVVDDVGLGKLVKYSGGVVRMIWGAGFVKVRWQVSLAATIKGLEKNFFAWANYNVLRGIVSVLGVGVMFIWPWVGLFVGSTPERILAAVVVLVQIVVAGLSARRAGYSPLHGLTAAFGGACLGFAMLRSMWKTLTRGGIVWRDHFYPLKELKQFKL